MEPYRFVYDQLVDEHRSFLPLLKCAAHSLSVSPDKATLDPSFFAPALRDNVSRRSSNIPSLCGSISATNVKAAPGTHGFCRSSCPARLQSVSLDSTVPLISIWFDDSPTRGVFTISNHDVPALPYGAGSREHDESAICDDDSIREIDELSVFTFGPRTAVSPAPGTESQGSATIVPTEADGDSTRPSSPKHQLFDCLDEQLLYSPIDSFAAMCWDSAVMPEQPVLQSGPQFSKLRLSRLYDEAAQEYEEEQLHESLGLATFALPRIQFSTSGIPKVVPMEVAPWLYLPEKAVSMLGLPRASRLSRRAYGTTSGEIFYQHCHGQASFGSVAKVPFSLRLAGMCRKAINRLSAR